MRLRINKFGNKSSLRKDEYGKSNFFTSIYFCKNCGNEVFSLWQVPVRTFQNKENEDCVNERNEFRSLEKCPICNSHLLKEAGFYSESTTTGNHPWNKAYNPAFENFGVAEYKLRECLYGKIYHNLNDEHELIFDELTERQNDFLDLHSQKMEEKRFEKEKTMSEKLAADFVSEKSLLTITDAKAIQNVETIKSSTEKLKEYILNLINLENSIYSLENRLSTLYYQRLLNQRGLNGDKYKDTCELISTKFILETCIKQREKIEAEPLPTVEFEYPSEPIEPTYQVPGLFNKAKVNAENEALKNQYELQLKEYHNQIREIEEQAEKVKEDAQIIKNEKIALLEEKCSAVEHYIQEINARICNSNEIMELTPYMAIKSILDGEIENAEALMQNLLETRNKLYSYNIVFGKYRNVVALSTFYEYLLAGRCKTLEGADGAYNIYEQECKANIMIAQLNDVIASLESIKETQYMMYNELKVISASLSQLNTTMNKTFDTIKSIDSKATDMNSYMESISENTEVIAHNTAVTAYYSKLNAELTNSLGYMIALS